MKTILKDVRTSKSKRKLCQPFSWNLPSLEFSFFMKKICFLGSIHVFNQSSAKKWAYTCISFSWLVHRIKELLWNPWTDIRIITHNWVENLIHIQKVSVNRGLNASVYNHSFIVVLVKVLMIFSRQIKALDRDLPKDMWFKQCFLK